MRFSKLTLALPGLFLLVSLVSVSAQAQISTSNLLVNPGAETGALTGWTKGGQSNPFVGNAANSLGDNIGPHMGSFEFVGGSGGNGFGTLSQNISLLGAAGITAGDIDAGNLTANISFWEQGLDQGFPSDDAYISLSFLDGNNGLISTVSTPEIDSHFGIWANFSNSYIIPTGARIITYTMNFQRHVGTDVDGFVDDNSLTVTGLRAAVPEPGNIALLAGMTLSGAGFLARRRKHSRKAA